MASFQDVKGNLKTLTIPAQNYTKFTSKPGKMPHVVIEMWQNIWQMTTADLAGKRAYLADFEVYDKRSQDPQNAVLDVCIGIQK